MEWDLALPPEDAARLTRLRLLTKLREARARSRAVRIVWHDGPDAKLAKAGLALAEQRGQWRLERMRPADAVRPGIGWAPATPPPVLAEAATRAGLAAAMEAERESTKSPQFPLPEQLIPSAAFEGRALGLSLRYAGEAVELTLLQGAIRTVMREHPACRLRLSGPAPATTAIALLLAAEIGLAVPRASLAEAALAAARGSAPTPRALGAPTLSPEFTVAEAFDHIVAHLTDVILYWAPLAAAGDGVGGGPEPVHQMRVAARRLRSALSVFRRATGSPSVDRADAGLKALTAALGPAREWDVFTAGIGAQVSQAFDAEPQDSRVLVRLLEAAERQRLAGYEGLRRFLAAPEFRQLGIGLAALAAARPWQTELDEAARAALEPPLVEFAAAVLARRHKRMFAEGQDIDHLDTASLHDIRLRAKRLRYAAEFFAALFPHKATRRFIGRLAALQERLGALNDDAAVAGLLSALPGGGAERAFAMGVVRGFAAANTGASRAGIAQTWKKFRKQEPFWT